LNLEREKIKFNVLRNALYHTARRRVYEAWNRRFNFIVIVLGTAAAADLSTKVGLPGYQLWTGGAVAVVGAMQLVFDFGRSARDHQSLQRDYYRLLAEIELFPDPEVDQCTKWWSEIMRITAEEPPVLRAIDAKAYNDAIDSLGTFDNQTERLVIPWMQRIFGGFFHFDGHSYKKLSELRQLQESLK
jgi:hypothetical protein